MDNKVTKKRILLHLEYDWIKYVAAVLLSVFLSYFVFMQININREFEIINVFFSCYETNDARLATDFEEELARKGDTVIRDVKVAYKDPKIDSYGQLLTAEGFIDDVIILPEKYMFSYAMQFVAIEDEVLEACVPENMRDSLEYYVYDEEGRDPDRVVENFVGKRFGIRIDNLPKLMGENSPFIFNIATLYPDMSEEDQANYESVFYIVMNRQSLHVGEHGKKKKYYDLTQSYDFINYFLTKYGTAE